MFKGSRFLSLLSWIHAVVKISFLFRLAGKSVAFISNSFHKSKFKRLLVGKNCIEHYYEMSVFAGFMRRLSAFFVSGIDYFTAAYKNSKFSKLANAVCKNSLALKTIISVPALCSVMFIVPHDLWNNLFAAAIAVFVLVLAIIKRPNKNYKLPYVWFSMVLFAISIAFSLISSYDLSDSLRTLIFFITAFILCIAINIYITDTNRLAEFLKWMFIAVVITSVIAFIQRIAGIETSTEFTDPTVNEGMPGRAFATLGNPNNFAEFLILFIPFAFVYAINHTLPRKKAVCLAGVVLGAGALILTYSRSGWIAFAVALLVYVTLYNKKYLPYLIVIAIIAIPLLPQSVLNRILTIGNLEDTSSSYRLHIWEGCAKMLRDHWISGVGLGSGGFKTIFPSYSIMSTSSAPHSHMQFLEMAIELGIVGFITYVAFTFTTIKRSFVSSKCDDKFLQSAVIASASAMTGIILIGFFEYCWFYPRVLFAFFVCMGVCMATVRLSRTCK